MSDDFVPGDIGIIGPAAPDGNAERETQRLASFILAECTQYGVPRVDEFHPRGMTAVDAAIAVIRHLKAELDAAEHSQD